jgi:hypothetical protein
MFLERRHLVELVAVFNSAMEKLWRKAQQDAAFRLPRKFKLKHINVALKLATRSLVKRYGVFHVPLVDIMPTRCNSASTWFYGVPTGALR